MKAVVLGAGMVGAAIVRDMACHTDFDVTVADLNSDALHKFAATKIHTIKTDLSQPQNIIDTIQDASVVVSAVPGFLGFSTLKKVIEARKNVVDITFMSEDPFLLDRLAKENGVTAVVDFGVAPGISNLLCGHARSLLEKANRCLIMVGGLPRQRSWPWEYKMPFSPVDVLEEYTRVARFVERGKIVEYPPLSEPELVTLPQAGTLEAFNTDGLRTLIRTLDIPFMKEKTLRYPGYLDKLRLLVDTGFLSKEIITINNTQLRPIDLTSKLLFEAWRLQEGEEEFTVMQVKMEGENNGTNITYTYDLFDQYDQETNTTSMARTTGFPASIMAQLLVSGAYAHTGIIPPEIIGREKNLFEIIIHELRKRGINIHLK